MRQVFTNPDGSGTIYGKLNPVTRSSVRFTEPFYFQSTEQRDAFIQAFHAYCDRMWASDLRGDPLVVDPYKIWAGDESYVDESLAVLSAKMDELVAEFGVWATVRTALKRVDKSHVRQWLEEDT
jgi:hypothetical protein